MVVRPCCVTSAPPSAERVLAPDRAGALDEPADFAVPDVLDVPVLGRLVPASVPACRDPSVVEPSALERSVVVLLPLP
ncbi:hypothetical protein GCM10010411_12230 [Actinomadura fulvescens]|uniref:Uncharacterized protein n=1 Tax=Actinomadura fulvescens TaxID=46160 RepID=A0ABP6BPV9_9ACTN